MNSPDVIRSIIRAACLVLVMSVATIASAAEPFRSIYIEAARARLAALTTNQPNATVLHSITNLPAGVRERLVGTADAGEPFSSGCVREYAGRRFLTASKVDNTYIVAIEHGGIVYNWLIVAFVVNDAGKVIREAEPASAADRDRPVSPETNRPPPATGPGC